MLEWLHFSFYYRKVNILILSYYVQIIFLIKNTTVENLTSNSFT